MEKIKLFSMFAGYGTDNFALKRLGIPYECVGFSEIDKYAVQCFQQNHNGKNYGDCRKIDPTVLPDFNLLTAGFPCQSFSQAGKMGGESDPRGSLFYEIIRIAEVKKPEYMLLENVKGLTCKKFKSTFDKILSELNRIGYNVYWKVLNSKDFGIPQSRARVWFVCLRKDIDKPFKFRFPKPIELKIFIKDILETKVDEKYYLSEKLQQRFKEYIKDKILVDQKTKKGYNNLVPTLRSGQGSGNKFIVTEKKDKIVIEGTIGERFGSCNTILSKESITQTLSASMGLGGGYVPKIRDNLIINCVGTCFGRMESSSEELDMIKRVGISENKICPSLYGFEHGTNKHFNDILPVNLGLLRRLTPKECFRLMGFLNDEINLDNISDTQRYKLAGNGQDVNMVSKIFEKMFKNEI